MAPHSHQSGVNGPQCNFLEIPYNLLSHLTQPHVVLSQFCLLCITQLSEEAIGGAESGHPFFRRRILKEVAFIAGKSETKQPQFFIFIDNLIANIRLYALSWPKLNFGCYLTFEIIF